MASPEDWDDVVFHEGTVSPQLVPRLEARLPGLRVVDMRRWGAFTLPPAASRMLESCSDVPPSGTNIERVGYKHMCRFMSMQVALP